MAWEEGTIYNEGWLKIFKSARSLCIITSLADPMGPRLKLSFSMLVESTTVLGTVHDLILQRTG